MDKEDIGLDYPTVYCHDDVLPSFGISFEAAVEQLCSDRGLSIEDFPARNSDGTKVNPNAMSWHDALDYLGHLTVESGID